MKKKKRKKESEKVREREEVGWMDDLGLDGAVVD